MVTMGSDAVAAGQLLLICGRKAGTPMCRDLGVR